MSILFYNTAKLRLDIHCPLSTMICQYKLSLVRFDRIDSWQNNGSCLEVISMLLKRITLRPRFVEIDQAILDWEVNSCMDYLNYISDTFTYIMIQSRIP